VDKMSENRPKSFEFVKKRELREVVIIVIRMYVEFEVVYFILPVSRVAVGNCSDLQLQTLFPLEKVIHLVHFSFCFLKKFKFQNSYKQTTKIKLKKKR